MAKAVNFVYKELSDVYQYKIIESYLKGVSFKEALLKHSSAKLLSNDFLDKMSDAFDLNNTAGSVKKFVKKVKTTYLNNSIINYIDANSIKTRKDSLEYIVNYLKEADFYKSGLSFKKSFNQLKKTGIFSDVGKIYKNSVMIDASIIKNCMEAEEFSKKSLKHSLEKKLGTKLENPIVCISYASGNDETFDLLKALNGLANVFVVGYLNRKETEEKIGSIKNIFFENRRGYLRYYYALADVSVNAENLHSNFKTLHNFIEATAGGPLFMVQPFNDKQLGYNELKRMGIVKEYLTYNDLKKNLVNYIKNFNEDKNLGVLGLRKEYLEANRHYYLPLIEELLNEPFSFQDTKRGLFCGFLENINSYILMSSKTHWENNLVMHSLAYAKIQKEEINN